MATLKLVLCSAAGAVIASALTTAAPSLAQQTPTDPAQTYAAARAQYEAQLQDYNQKRQAYERQRNEYNAEVDEYQRALTARASDPDTVVVVDDPKPDVVIVDRDSDTAVVVDDVPSDSAVVVTESPDVILARDSDDFTQRLLIPNVPPLVRLEDVAGLNQEFFNEPVVDAAGVPIGHFRRVETKDTWGGRLAVVITLDPTRRTIALPTEHVRLDPDRRIFIADMTARQIDTIPSGFPYG